AGRLAQPPVVGRLVVVDGLDVGAVGAARRDGDVGPRGVGDVAEGVGDGDPVAVGRPGHEAGVGEAHGVRVPVPRLDGAGVDQPGAVLVVAVDAVGEVLVVDVLV